MRLASMHLALLAGSAVILAAACGGEPSAVDHTPALIQVFNAQLRGVYLSAGGMNYSPVGGTFCIGVDPASPSTVTVYVSGSDSVLGTFTPAVQPRDKLSVFIYQNASGSTQFATAPTAFVPAAGSTGVRFFNGSSIAQDLYVTDGITGNDAPVVRGLAPGAASDYVNVPPGPRAVVATLVGLQARTAVWSGQNFVAGSNMTFAIPNYTLTPPYSPDCARPSVGLQRYDR